MQKGPKRVATLDFASTVAMVFAPIVLVLAVPFSSPGPQANTCIAPPPLKISGAVCGRVTDPTGAAASDVELRVVDEKGSVIGQARSNSSGDFKFSPLLKGLYRLTTTAPGFMGYIGQIEILHPHEMSCRRPISAELGLRSCDGGVSKNKPRDFHEPGW